MEFKATHFAAFLASSHKDRDEKEKRMKLGQSVEISPALSFDDVVKSKFVSWRCERNSSSWLCRRNLLRSEAFQSNFLAVPSQKQNRFTINDDDKRTFASFSFQIVSGWMRFLPISYETSSASSLKRDRSPTMSLWASNLLPGSLLFHHLQDAFEWIEIRHRIKVFLFFFVETFFLPGGMLLTHAPLFSFAKKLRRENDFQFLLPSSQLVESRVTTNSINQVDSPAFVLTFAFTCGEPSMIL